AGLAIFGGETLFAFSVIMMFGIVIGTYSSVYVAAPVILLWGAKRGEEEPEPVKAAKARPYSDVARNAPSLDAYCDGGFRRSGSWHEGSVLILRDYARPWSAGSLPDPAP